ncbi:hypothetical protein LCGC14_0892090 [marine sediment metagenome]|uniref:Uncharacterized protein n=1 Tax=marine sediment metagenome TaxID=412755 RepID=A0A0F9RI53_9ZZZZ
MFKKAYTGMPRGWDLVVQFLYWFSWKLGRFANQPSWWAYDILEKYCRCEKCLERQKRAMYGG